jgi:uncharacterized cupredoxin-like copper-binding protein
MPSVKLFVGAAALCLAGAASGVAVAAGAAPSGTTTIKAITVAPVVKINRYIEDTVRWNKDVYKVKSGGTLRIVNDAAQEGAHTFTVVAHLPRTAAAIENCRICLVLAKAHGANPGSHTPPKFQYLDGGVGQNTPPNVDGPGDSGITGPGKPGESITLTVTAKPGTVLKFMCLIHPWMQAKIIVK